MKKCLIRMISALAVLVYCTQTVHTADLKNIVEHKKTVRKKPVKITLYKTDRKTWNDEWLYGFSSNSVDKPARLYCIKKEAVTTMSPYRPVLWVCTSKVGDCALIDYKTVDLLQQDSQEPLVALDQEGTATVSTLAQIKQHRAPVKTTPIAVYKRSDFNTPWKLTAANQKDLTQPTAKIFGTTTIHKDTKRWGTKLAYPVDRDWHLLVNKGSDDPVETIFKKGEIPPDAIVVLDAQGKAFLDRKGQEPKFEQKSIVSSNVKEPSVQDKISKRSAIGALI